MTVTLEPAPPPFQLAAQAMGVLTVEEMDRLIAEDGPKVKEGLLGQSQTDANVRRSQTLLLKPDAGHKWLFDRIWAAAVDFNRNCFAVDINGIGSIQLARYDESDRGFYDWHLDFGELAPTRKISMTVQLSAPEDYEGGEMELAYGAETLIADRTRGSTVAFPSFGMHRVRPVTRGRRWSLVAWIVGPRWR